ncbi:hypothetical protein, partial [Olleya aquimaris]
MKISTRFSNSLNFLFKVFFLLFLTTFVSNSATAQETLDFRNPTIVNGGTNLAVGTQYRFQNVTTTGGGINVDALVTITASQAASLTQFDDLADHLGNGLSSFDPIVQIDGATIVNGSSDGGYVEFLFEFVLNSDNTQPIIIELDAYSMDVDGNNGDMREYVIISDFGGYTINNPSQLNYIPSGRFESSTDLVNPGINANSEFLAKTEYSAVSTFRYRAGVLRDLGIATTPRQFALAFEPISFTNPNSVLIIEASNDSGSVVEGVGGVAISNVLSNDSLGGNTPTTTDVTISQISTNNAGVTLNTSTGEVNVTPGTPSGSYVIEYQICETASPSNCSTAFANVTVLPDNDGDGIDDDTDLDDDNDGILDTNEGLCTPAQSGVWSISGTTASYDFGNGVIAQVSTTNAAGFTSGNFNNQSFWSENLANDSSLQNSYTWGSTLTVNFEDSLGNPVAVTNPIVHLDRLGGTDGATTQNGAIVTLQGGLTWTEVSTTSTDDFYVTGNTASDSGINTSANPGHTSESTQQDADGTAAGSLQINGEISTFTVEFVQGGLFGTGGDGIELILSSCESLDSDNDNIPDYLDTDSDNDGCFDALEGDAGITISQVDGSTGQITGGVDANGVPNLVSGGQADVSSTDNTTIGSECQIDAVDDDFSSSPINGFAGGSTATVLGNDTLNGVAVVPADITLTPGTAPSPASGSITMNADGTITVAAGTTAGTYTYDYTICENLNPTNCDTA